MSRVDGPGQRRPHHEAGGIESPTAAEPTAAGAAPEPPAEDPMIRKPAKGRAGISHTELALVSPSGNARYLYRPSCPVVKPENQGEADGDFAAATARIKKEHHLAVGVGQRAPATTKASPAALSMISRERRTKMASRRTSTPARPRTEEDGRHHHGLL